MSAFRVTAWTLAFACGSLLIWLACAVAGAVALASGVTIGWLFVVVGIAFVAINVWKIRLLLRLRRRAEVSTSEDAVTFHAVIDPSGDVEKKDKK